MSSQQKNSLTSKEIEEMTASELYRLAHLTDFTDFTDEQVASLQGRLRDLFGSPYRLKVLRRLFLKINYFLKDETS